MHEDLFVGVFCFASVAGLVILRIGDVQITGDVTCHERIPQCHMGRSAHFSTGKVRRRHFASLDQDGLEINRAPSPEEEH
jgi:hypothetical protein